MKVTLKRAHTHAGTTYPAGKQIDVSVVDALWLKAADLIDEAVADIKVELKKLATKEDPQPHAEALAKAEAAEASADAPAAPAAAAAPTAASTAALVKTPAAVEESKA